MMMEPENFDLYPKIIDGNNMAFCTATCVNTCLKKLHKNEVLAVCDIFILFKGFKMSHIKMSKLVYKTFIL